MGCGAQESVGENFAVKVVYAHLLMRHELALRAAGCANTHPARRGGVWPAASTSAGLHERRSEHSPAFSCFPRPIRRASPDTFPASRRRGAQPPIIALGGWDG